MLLPLLSVSTTIVVHVLYVQVVNEVKPVMKQPRTPDTQVGVIT